MKKICIALAIVALTGCATKQYPQAAAVTVEEATVFDCNTLDQEIAKARSVQKEIKEIGGFDGRTVMGFIGDFGIGNGIAKSSAISKADARLTQLESLKIARCTQKVK